MNRPAKTTQARLVDRRTLLINGVIGFVGLAISAGAAGKKILYRTLRARRRYLNIPVKIGAPERQILVRAGDENVRTISAELASGRPQYWFFMDLTPFKGRNLELTLAPSPRASNSLPLLIQADEILGHETIYREGLRPQFHYSTRRGWQSDPNGLVYYDGEYHLFYQHYPYSSQPTSTSDWPMHWGHAVSRDLVHWRELPVALYPEGALSIWSGSAVVDEDNRSGLQKGNEKSLVAFFTLANVKRMLTGKGQSFSQGLAYSNDRGRTWTPYSGNPVLPSVTAFNRDPRVIWYAPGRKWIMVLFLDRADYPAHPELNPATTMELYRDKGSYGFFSSPNLKEWRKLGEVRIPGEAECPDFYELAVDGNPKDTRWILQGATGFYLIGAFDGAIFTPESGPHRLHEGNGWYASQTFNNIPADDGRRILIPWAKSNDANGPIYKDMPFNQCMGIPVELTLRNASDGLRLLAWPVRELENLRVHSFFLQPQPLRPETNPLAGIRGELLDILTVIELNDATEISLGIRGVPLVYNVKSERLSCAGMVVPLKLDQGRLRLRVLVDRTLIEIFANGGQLYHTASVGVQASNTSLSISADRAANIERLEVHHLRSMWS
jgi:fructan beta-fructosidase